MAKFEVYSDKQGQFRWRLKANNNRIMADSGEGYASRASARQAAERVRAEVATAPIEDINQ